MVHYLQSRGPGLNHEPSSYPGDSTNWAVTVQMWNVNATSERLILWNHRSNTDILPYFFRILDCLLFFIFNMIFSLVFSHLSKIQEIRRVTEKQQIRQSPGKREDTKHVTLTNQNSEIPSESQSGRSRAHLMVVCSCPVEMSFRLVSFARFSFHCYNKFDGVGSDFVTSAHERGRIWGQKSL